MSRQTTICTLLTICFFFALPVAGGGKHLPPPPMPMSSGSAQTAYPTGQQDPSDPNRREDPLCPDPQFGEHRNGPESHICEDMHNKQNKARHDSLKKDTDHLLELATELKQYVDKSNENTLSLDVIKKAEEVEKLAKKVKEKMRG